MNRDEVAAALDLVVGRLDRVLNPWGFEFVGEGLHGSHTGPYGSGYYVRGTTQIRISCRATLDNVYYRHSLITQNVCSRETETFTIGHDTLMDTLGHSNDCWLITTNRPPDNVAARESEDALAAFIHDLTEIAAVVLRNPSDDFTEIMRMALERGRLNKSCAKLVFSPDQMDPLPAGRFCAGTSGKTAKGVTIVSAVNISPFA